jgi:hypothetical protein
MGNAEGRRLSAFFIFHFSFFTLLRTLPLIVLLLAPPASARPSQNDVFKSIQDNVGQSDESATKAIPWVCGGIGVIIILAIFGRRQTRSATPRTVNHPGKLIKEIMDEVPLKPKELKQLKTVADEITDPDSETPTNPLVLLLCPSVLGRAIRDDSTRADRKILKVLLKKLAVR